MNESSMPANVGSMDGLGVRCATLPDGPHKLEPGQYGLWQSIWYARPPIPNRLLANLSKHEVTEHADGTITVKPSIDVSAGALGRWHGFLKRGVWTRA